MYKLGKILCERCRAILAENHNFLKTSPEWEVVYLQRSGGRRRRMDFCDERCRIIALRGRKYWQRKLQYLREADRLVTRSRYFRDMRPMSEAVISPDCIVGIHEEETRVWMMNYNLDWTFQSTCGRIRDFNAACRDLMADGLVEVAKPQKQDA